MRIAPLLAACLLLPTAVWADQTRPSGSPAAKASAAAMDRMMNAMDIKPTGDPDRDFARMMIPHHQGAIEMAKIELQYGKDPAMLALAKAIVGAQEGEIAAMKGFLAKRP
jgi:uncharacterized protein (DUF305 family)